LPGGSRIAQSVRIAVATNPTAVMVSDMGISHDGDALADPPDLQAFCKSY